MFTVCGVCAHSDEYLKNNIKKQSVSASLQSIHKKRDRTQYKIILYRFTLLDY